MVVGDTKALKFRLIPIELQHGLAGGSLRTYCGRFRESACAGGDGNG
jgi:hypothetical protein